MKNKMTKIKLSAPVAKPEMPNSSEHGEAQFTKVQFMKANSLSDTRQEHLTKAHGETLNDPYNWVRAENWQDVLQDGGKLPDLIKKHLNKENNYTKRVLKNTETLQANLVKEMKARIKQDDSSVPLPDGPFAYYVKYIENEEHPVFCRKLRDAKQEDDSQEEVLLDGNNVAQKHKFCDIAEAGHSPDHKLLAWSCDTEGSEFYTIRIRSNNTGWDKRERILMTDGKIVWAKDSKSFFYVKIDESHRPRSVCRHWVSGSVHDDEIIYSEADDEYFVDLTATQSGDYAIINVSGHDSSQEWLIDLADDYVKARMVAPRRANILYESTHRDNQLFIKTNTDGAEDFKIVTAPLNAPTLANWVDYITHKPGVMIISMQVFKNHLVRLEIENCTPRIIIHRFSDKHEHSIVFDQEAFDLELVDGFEFDTDIIRFTYSSMVEPREVYQYNLETRERVLLKRDEIPSSHNPADYVTKRLFATAEDNELVPISLIYKRGLILDSSAPCLLYGYGAYGSSSPPVFESEPLSLVDRGFVYAIAHVRGGIEKGWNWYNKGKLHNKINTFTDFIAVAQHLCAEGYTTKGLIVAQGVSAGGMLMGAVVNMTPDLFAGIIADVPFVDVLNTIMDGTLPLTPPEWLEWGNPIADIESYKYIKSYSPYDNIVPQHYPPILALGGLTDPRVTYWEPTKWVLKLRANMTSGGPIMLKTNMTAGHGGASGRFERLDDIALTYAFAIAAVHQRRAQVMDEYPRV